MHNHSTKKNKQLATITDIWIHQLTGPVIINQYPSDSEPGHPGLSPVTPLTIKLEPPILFETTQNGLPWMSTKYM